jgi:uracil-DNA glycosylase
MEPVYPFGSPLQKVEQQDKSPKKVFVLGVYASAVHAKWIDVDGKVKVNALAVASEPYIFWKGDGAKEIVEKIKIPSALGTLVAADERFNGPSGKILDEFYLDPLRCKREDAWLCDLLPYSRINPNQEKAIETNYNPLVETYNLPECSIPVFNPSELKNQVRLDEILVELEQSQAETIILLGDLPIKHFLSHFSRFKKLSEFVNEIDDYGKTIKIKISGKPYNIIPLVHPRQAGKMGKSNSYWNDCHMMWTMKKNMLYIEKEIRGYDPSQILKKPLVCPICHSRLIGSYVYELPADSKKTRQNLKKGKIVLLNDIPTIDDPKYFCFVCKFDFFEINN